MQLEIMTCPMSGPGGLYFPYNLGGGGYSMESYRPEYSGNRVTDQDCRTLLADVNGCPMTRAVCDKGAWFICVNFLLLAICMPLYMVFATRQTVTVSGNDEFGTALGMGMGLIIGLGMVTLITNACILLRRRIRRELARKQVITAILNNHNNTTLSAKHAVAQLSKFGGYITIQFLWVTQTPVNPLSNVCPAKLMNA